MLIVRLLNQSHLGGERAHRGKIEWIFGGTPVDPARVGEERRKRKKMKIKIVKTRFKKTENKDIFNLIPANTSGEDSFQLEDGCEIFTAEFVDDESCGITIEIIQ